MRRELPIALTIAGSDSGGAAGIQADLKTFAALGVHGASVVTAITAQNPKRVRAVEPCSPRIVRAQLTAVFEEIPPRAAKTGMLFSADIIREVARFFRNQRKCPLVVDPVMIATSGASLLQRGAVEVLKNQLLPLATLVTPNIPEAEALLGIMIREPEDLREAARMIHQQFGCAALVKGGHLRHSREAIDIFYGGKTELLLSARYVRGVRTHGTGCTYSAAIAAELAKGASLQLAVQFAKTFVTHAIVEHQNVSSHAVLNWFAARSRK